MRHAYWQTIPKTRSATVSKISFQSITSSQERNTHDLKLILPKLLLARLVKEREISNVMNKDIAQNRQFRVDGRNLAELRSKGGAEALQRSGGVELGNFFADLTGDKLALEI
jgi:hypothetical protein